MRTGIAVGITDTDDALISPVDGAVSQIGRLDGSQIVQAKGHAYSLEALLDGGDVGTNWAKRFVGGSFATVYLAPFDGTVTNLPVREGETVVVGIQNAPGSTLMTLSDLSTITAEVMVDETDIVNVKLGQEAEVRARPRRAIVRLAREADVAVRAGLGRSLLPCRIADGFPGLSRLSGAKPILSREMWMIVHPDLKHLARVRAVISWIEQIMSERPI